MNENYYVNQDYYYTEYAVALEDFYYKSKGKFAIPALFPHITSSTPSKSSKVLNTNNLDEIYNSSISKLSIKKINTQNYIELSVPEYIGTFYKDYETGIIRAGTKFIITFVGGDLSCPHIIGGM